MVRQFKVALVLVAACAVAAAQPAQGNFDAATKIFRLDGGNSSYIFGVNPRGELQQLYWGGRLGAHDAYPAAVPMPEWASFDSSYSNTPQEYPGWGNGLDLEPALKVSFANGNRELLLLYQSHTATAQGFDVVLKDISLNILVTLHYSMDPDTGILAR